MTAGRVSRKSLSGTRECRDKRHRRFLSKFIAAIIEIIISIEVIDMIREAPAMTVRRNLGEILNEVQYRRDKVVITKGGKPVAALIDIALFEKIRRLDDEFERLTRELAQAFERIPADEGMALVNQAVRAVRKRPAKG